MGRCKRYRGHIHIEGRSGYIYDGQVSVSKIRIIRSNRFDCSLFFFNFWFWFCFDFTLFFSIFVFNTYHTALGHVATRFPQMVNTFAAFGTMLFLPCHLTGSQLPSVTKLTEKN